MMPSQPVNNPQNSSSGDRHSPYDLIIIGGGINGAGIARDATLRGLSVCLIEKRDFGTGATGASSGMIHGGLRYLLSDPEVTRLSCLDSGYIQKIAPHLIFRIPFIVPVLGTGKRKRVLLELTEVYFECYDRHQPLKKGKSHCRLSRDETLQLVPGLTTSLAGSVTTDEWGVDAHRLALLNIIDAHEHGADVFNYSAFTGLISDGDQVIGVTVKEDAGGSGQRDIFGKTVVNATGAWADHLLKSRNRTKRMVRPGKGVHLVYPGRITNYAIVGTAIDGRQIFIMPHLSETWIGTTDDDYFGDPDNVPVLEDEVSYLLEGIRSILPEIDKYRISRTMVGCRPTLYKRQITEDSLSRDHRIFDHENDGAKNLFSIVGGKLASYRIMSQEVTDTICLRLGNSKSCETHSRPLPGGSPHDTSVAPYLEQGLSHYTAQRILSRHGDRSEQILEMMRKSPGTRSLVCPTGPVTEAELRYVLRNELIGTLDDVRRRCHLSRNGRGGMAPLYRAAQIFCEEKGIHPDQAQDMAKQVGCISLKERLQVQSQGQLSHEERNRYWAGFTGYTSPRRELPGTDEVIS